MAIHLTDGERARELPTRRLHLALMAKAVLSKTCLLGIYHILVPC